MLKRSVVVVLPVQFSHRRIGKGPDAQAAGQFFMSRALAALTSGPFLIREVKNFWPDFTCIIFVQNLQYPIGTSMEFLSVFKGEIE